MERLLVPLLNHLLRQEEWAATRLRAHAGGRISIEAGALRLGLGIDEQGRFSLATNQQAPDVVLTLPADVPLKLLFDRENLFSSVRLAGSVDLAETLAFVFRNLSWDVEADLASLVGDIAAHRLTRFGRTLGTALSSAVKRSGENLVEYIAEESGTLISGSEMMAFNSTLADLRDDLARLEKRVAGLRQ